MAASPLWVSEELEYWDSNIRFTHIAATYSELIAISTQGQLHQWRWSDAHPYQRNDVSDLKKMCYNFYNLKMKFISCYINMVYKHIIYTIF